MLAQEHRAVPSLGVVEGRQGVDFGFVAPKALRRKEVALHSLSWEDFVAARAELIFLLTSGEREIFERLSPIGVSDRFAAQRALVHLAMGTAAGVEPQAVTFRITSRGRFVSVAYELSAVVRLAGDTVLCAVARDSNVGIGMEHRAARLPFPDALADFCFSPRERALHDARTGEARAASLFLAWAAKVAVLTADEEDWELTMREIEVDLPIGRASLTGCRGGKSLSLIQMTPRQGHVAVVACAHDASIVSQLEWRLVPEAWP